MLEAVTPKATLQVEGDDARMDSRYAKGRQHRKIVVTGTDSEIECLRMIEYEGIRSDLYSTSETPLIGWADKRLWQYALLMKFTTLSHLPALVKHPVFLS